MRSLLAANRGAITAEWALALPAVILTASVLFAGIGLLLERTRLDQAAADIVRLIGLGASPQRAMSHAEEVFGDSLSGNFELDDSNHRVCVHLFRTRGIDPSGLLSSLRAEGQACGLAVTHQ